VSQAQWIDRERTGRLTGLGRQGLPCVPEDRALAQPHYLYFAGQTPRLPDSEGRFFGRLLCRRIHSAKGSRKRGIFFRMPNGCLFHKPRYNPRDGLDTEIGIPSL
jgi:hypothetical protein